METRDKIKMPGFDFLISNIRRQRELAKQTIERAEEIDELLQSGNITESAAQKALEETKQGLLFIAHELALNANATIRMANTILEKLRQSRQFA